jgi:glycosyltransferase involved in cell wall biosynthesis
MAALSEHGPRLAVSLPALDTGGAEMAMLRVAAGFAARGTPTDLVVARASDGLRDQVPDDVRVVVLGARSPLVATKTVALARYLVRERPRALISALDVVNSASVARSLSRAPTKVLLTVQTHLSRQFSDKPDRGVATLRRGLVRALYPRSDVLVAASQGVADDVARIARIDPARIAVVPNPVVTPDLERQARTPVEHRFLDGDGPPVIVGVGRLVRQKDFATLVRAFAQVRARRPARLLILGGADPRERETERDLRALIGELGLDDDVDLPGWVDVPAAYMARAQVFALSSIYEGFGNVVAEALAVGTPVVATDCESGPAEILDGGRYGRLVPVGDPTALADGILSTLDGPPDPRELRRRADRYRTDRIVDEYQALLDGTA